MSPDTASLDNVVLPEGSRIVTGVDREYPRSVLDLTDPPAQLFVRGKRLDHLGPSVAVVGARRCSAYGEEAAEGIGRGLASAGVTVVSGAAWGVDAAAHRGALAARGVTVAVLGSGIDVPYPHRNRGLIEEIAATGSLVTEYRPGTQPEPFRFPARNRIVAALARAVVIVEGAEGSGSMITAEFALDLGREVFAVPGPVTSPLSAVPNALIREGATLARGSDDVLSALGMRAIPPVLAGHNDSSEGDLSDDDRRVFERVLGEPVTAEAVARDLGVSVGPVLASLASLELRGLVRGVGGRYERVALSS
ncbi:MAG: DNA-processing protein DprA [Actinomycetota bacterium]